MDGPMPIPRRRTCSPTSSGAGEARALGDAVARSRPTVRREGRRLPQRRSRAWPPGCPGLSFRADGPTGQAGEKEGNRPRILAWGGGACQAARQSHPACAGAQRHLRTARGGLIPSGGAPCPRHQGRAASRHRPGVPRRAGLRAGALGRSVGPLRPGAASLPGGGQSTDGVRSGRLSLPVLRSGCREPRSRDPAQSRRLPHVGERGGSLPSLQYAQGGPAAARGRHGPPVDAGGSAPPGTPPGLVRRCQRGVGYLPRGDVRTATATGLAPANDRLTAATTRRAPGRMRSCTRVTGLEDR